MNVDKKQKRCSVSARLRRYLLAMMICIFQSSTIYATDLLVIEEIELRRPAGGFDLAVRDMFEQLGSVAAMVSVEFIKGKLFGKFGDLGDSAGGGDLSDLVDFDNIDDIGNIGGEFISRLDPITIVEEYEKLTPEERQEFETKALAKALNIDYDEIKAISDAGSSAARGVMDYLDDTYSGQDDLIVTVNGETVIPAAGAGAFHPISAGQKISTEIRVSFDRGVRVRFIEHDSGSDNDNLGVFEFNSDKQLNIKPDAIFRGKSVILAPSREDGSAYLLTWRVERNKGDPSKAINNMICGTNQCNACFNDACIGQKISDLDRDGDLSDLLSCPFPFKVTGFQGFDQIWPFDDVYLRVCGSTCPSISTPVIHNRGVAQNNKPFFEWTSVANAKKYQIFEQFDANSAADISRVAFLTPTWLSYAQMRARKPGTYQYRVRGATEDETCTGDFSEVLTLVVPEVPVSLTVVTASEDSLQRGSGSVTVSPEPRSTIGGIFYTPGDVVVLRAVPTARSEFAGWSGNAAGCGAQLSCGLAINRGEDLNVQALFRPKPTLKFAPIGQGSVSVDPVGLACNFENCFNYFTGTPVSLTPNAGELSDFIGWTGDDICTSNEEILNLTLNSDIVCRAQFKRNHYTLDVTASEGSQVSSVPASIDCGDVCQETYPVSSGAQTVELNAVIDPGFVFVRWAGDFDCWDEDEADNNPLSISVTVGEKDVECSVVVVPEGTEFALTIEKLGGGTVKALAEPVVDSSGIDCTLKACSQDYPVNTQVQLSAKASPGSEFIGFESPDVGSDGYDPENDDCIDGQINMIENISCVASFKTHILVVDGTDSGLNKEQNPYIGPMNNQELVDYKIWDVYSPSSGDNSTDPITLEKREEPVAEDLAEFGRVIWYTGYASSQATLSRNAGPSAAAEESLAEYLDNSGCLMMSSPEYVKDRGLTPFMQTYFGLSEVTQDVVEEYVEGAGDPSFGFNELTVDSFKGTGSEGYFRITDGTNGQFLSDSLVRDPDAQGSEALFKYRDSGAEAAVGLDNGVFRTVFFGFPFLGISNGQNTTLGAFLDFCGQPESDDLFEVNDDFDTAVVRSGPLTLDSLKILTGNDDYFRWTSDWYADASIRIAYTQSKGDLAVEVYNSNSVLLASSDNHDGAEQILIEDVDSGQTFFVRIFGVDDAEGAYSLEITPSGPIDRDHDGVADEDDALPEDASEQFDADGDLIGDNADLDDDNDGLPDAYELLNGFDPLVENPITDDTDQDTFTDIQEFFAQTDPRDAASFPQPVLIQSGDDSDADEILDVNDNCAFVANNGQRDTNDDGYGNHCDADLDNDDLVNVSDLLLFKAAFNTDDADADLDGSVRVNFADLVIFKELFDKPPGPSGLVD